MNRNRRMLFLLTAGVAAAVTAVAQEGPSDAPAASMTLAEIIRTGGPLMYVLGALSVAGLAFVIYLAVSLRASAIVPRGLQADLFDTIDAGRRDEARMLCRRDRSAFGVIAEAALSYVDRTPEPDFDLVKEIVEGEGGRQAGQIQNQIQYLLDIAVVAPMVGLLGTVMGMLQAFNAVALDIAKARPMVLAHGVSQALITTAAGLIVGIPAMVFYAYFRGRSSQLISQLEAASAEFVLRLPKKGRAP